MIAGFAATCNGLSSAQLTATYPQSGGTYEYGYQVLNPCLGLSAGWMFLASKISAGLVVGIGFGSYLAELIPGVPLVIGIGVATSMLAVLLSQLFGISRMMFVMARKTDLPAFLEKVHPKHHVPHIGKLVSVARTAPASRV